MTDQREHNGDSSDIQGAFTREARLSEEGAHPRLRLSQVYFRWGSRFISVWWLVPGGALFAVVAVVAFKVFYTTSTAQSFIKTHPCVQSTPKFPPGIPIWVIVTHALNFFLIVMILRAGWQILADHPRLYRKLHCTPDSEWLRFRGPIPKTRVWTAKDDAIMLSPLVGMPGGRHTIGVARHWHFIFDILFVINGIVFIVLTFTTMQYLKIVPTQWSILPAAGSCILQYGALYLPSEPGGFFRFDAIQQLSYFFIVFITAPLAILTGLAMSPALDNRFKWYQRLFGNRQIARSMHFIVMVTFVAFFAIHMLMVFSTQFSKNLNGITLGGNEYNLNGVMLTVAGIAVTIAFGSGRCTSPGRTRGSCSGSRI